MYDKLARVNSESSHHRTSCSVVLVISALISLMVQQLPSTS